MADVTAVKHLLKDTLQQPFPYAPGMTYGNLVHWQNLLGLQLDCQGRMLMGQGDNRASWLLIGQRNLEIHKIKFKSYCDVCCNTFA